MTPSERTDGDAPTAPADAGSSLQRPELLFVTRKWAPAVGGMETYSLKLSEELKSEANVTVLALPGKADGSAPGFGSVVFFGLRTAKRLFLGADHIDIVHVGDMSSWPLALTARLRSRKRRVVLSAHGTDVAFSERPGVLPFLYGIYMKLGARLVGRVTVLANSRATKSRTEALGFKSVIVIPLATDMGSETDARQKPEHGRKILFAGRLVPRKGCRWFIENVLPALPQDVTLDVAGTIWDDDEERALKSDRVRYLGALTFEALGQAYRDADCVVVPNIETTGTDFEGFGLVAAEAAAAGGLVLASNHTGLKDAVIDGETGISLPPGDAVAWVDAVKEVLDWPEATRDAFVRNASAVAKQHFSWSRVAKSTFEAYGWAG